MELKLELQFYEIAAIIKSIARRNFEENSHPDQYGDWLMLNLCADIIENISDGSLQKINLIQANTSTAPHDI